MNVDKRRKFLFVVSTPTRGNLDEKMCRASKLRKMRLFIKDNKQSKLELNELVGRNNGFGKQSDSRVVPATPRSMTGYKPTLI